MPSIVEIYTSIEKKYVNAVLDALAACQAAYNDAGLPPNLTHAERRGYPAVEVAYAAYEKAEYAYNIRKRGYRASHIVPMIIQRVSQQLEEPMLLELPRGSGDSNFTWYSIRNAIDLGVIPPNSFRFR